MPTALRLTNKHISSEPRSLVPRREDIDIVIGYDDFTTETILPSSSCSARSNQILPSQSIKDSTAGSSDVMLLDSNNSIGHVTSNDDDKVNGGSRFFPQPSSAVYEPAHFLKGLQRHSCNIKHATPHTTSDYSLESVPSKYDATRVIHEEYLPLRSDLTSTNLALHHPVPVRRSRLIGSEALHNYSFAIGKSRAMSQVGLRNHLFGRQATPFRLSYVADQDREVARTVTYAAPCYATRLLEPWTYPNEMVMICIGRLQWLSPAD